MKKFAFLTGLALVTTLQIAHADDMNVGVREFLSPSKERGINLHVTIWYPAQIGGEEALLGNTPFFSGTTSMRDAPILKGKFPLILLSHGTGIAGNAGATSWIAASLAKHGYIVAAPNHPGNQSGNRSAGEAMKLWLRPADFTSTLDALKISTAFQNKIDWEKVGALGLSMGGYTALAVAGAKVNQQRLASYCDNGSSNNSLCEWIKQSGVDLHTMNLQPAGQNYRDNRIRSAVAVDPAMVGTLTTESIASITIPVDLINLGRSGEVPPTVDVSQTAKLIPHARYSTIDRANHFSMFAECKAGASEALKAKGITEALCDNVEGRSRGEIHAQLINMVAAAFKRTFNTEQ